MDVNSQTNPILGEFWLISWRFTSFHIFLQAISPTTVVSDLKVYKNSEIYQFRIPMIFMVIHFIWSSIDWIPCVSFGSIYGLAQFFHSSVLCSFCIPLCIRTFSSCFSFCVACGFLFCNKSPFFVSKKILFSLLVVLISLHSFHQTIHSFYLPFPSQLLFFVSFIQLWSLYVFPYLSI